jgi:signal transduction histidine kinase/ligand-binding sensor domain-containing protein
MHYRRIILPLCVTLLSCGIVCAQQPYFQEENFTSPTTEIKHVAGIASDRNNCIWFATQTGIYRYDGSRFRHYSVLNTPTLKFERMTNMAVRLDKGGFGWCFGDTKGNLYEVDSLSRIHPYSVPQNSGEQIIYEKYFYHYFNSRNKKISPNLSDSTFETYITPVTKRAFLLTITGKIISMPVYELLNGGKGKVIHTLNSSHTYRQHYGTKTFATEKNFYVIDSDGTSQWRNYESDPTEISLSGDINNTTKPVDYNNLVSLKTTNPKVILLWYEGNIYEAFESADNKSLHTRLLIKGNEKEPPASSFYSPEQQLFISYSLTKGLIFYRPKQFRLLSVSPPNSQLNEDDYYYSLLRDKEGFITVSNKGIFWLGNNGSQRAVVQEECYKYFIFQDRIGNLWYSGTQKNSIFYIDKTSGKTAHVLDLKKNHVFTGAYQSNDSTFYILTSRSLTKIILTQGRVKFMQELHTASREAEFTVLYAVNDRTLWIGSDKGMEEFSITNNRLKIIPELKNTYVRAAIKLAENNFLLGTYDKGIFQFNKGKWDHLSSVENEMPSSAHAFIIDTITSSLWVSSNKGIINLPLAQLLNDSPKNNITFQHFTNLGPDISIEFNGSSNTSSAQLSDTCFAFANANGIVVFNPLNLVSHPLPSNVLIETNSGKISDLILTGRSTSNDVEFNPVIPYYGNRNDLAIHYRLTNADPDWHKLAPNSNVSYNNLRPGDYEIQFRIKNYSALQDEEVLIQAGKFSIPHRWFETTWFKIGAVLLAIAILVFLHYLRIWYILKRRKELEQLVKVKTSELKDANENLVSVIDELTVSEANLKLSNQLKNDYYAVLTHDLRSPLKFLTFNLSQILEHSPDLKNETLRKGLFAAHQCSTDVYKLTDEFIYWIQDNENQINVKPSPTPIKTIVEDAYKIYAFSLESNKNSFISDIPSDLVFGTDPKLLFIIMRNAVDNANKYTHRGTISVTASKTDGTLKIIVSDTGRGMNQEKIDFLMNLQHETVQLSYEQRKSLGFYIMAMLTKILGGNYTISSNDKKGTELCFNLPELKFTPNSLFDNHPDK